MRRLASFVSPPITVLEPQTSMIVDDDVPITVRDGTVLRVNCYRPVTDEPVPVIMWLIRTARISCPAAGVAGPGSPLNTGCCARQARSASPHLRAGRRRTPTDGSVTGTR